MSAQILIAEDMPDLQLLMSQALDSEGYVTQIAATGEAAIEALTRSKPDLAIIDWMLPGPNGVEICRRFRGKLPLLMVTARDEPQDIVQGLDAGADDYLTKPFAIAVLLARVRALLRRAERQSQSPQSPVLKLGDLQMDTQQVEVRCAETPIALTASEFKLLHLLMKNQGKVLSRTQLVELSHGPGIHVVDRVIDTLVYQIRKKLGPCGDLFETVRGVGYRVRDT